MAHSNALGNRERLRRLPVESIKLILDDVAGNPLGMWRLDETDGLWVDEEGRGLDIDEVKEAVLRLVSTCAGCDERGEAIRQQPNGNLVCQLCGRLVSSEEQPDAS